MKKGGFTYLKCLCAALMAMLCLFSMPERAGAAEAERPGHTPRVVRVGVSDFPNFSRAEADGSYSGIIFDYLGEISKYNGWQLEVVPLTAAECLKHLTSGDIDLMGAMIKNEQTVDLYDFAELSSGYSYSTVTVKKSRMSKHAANNYDSLNGMRVGIYTKAISRINDFEQFCALNGVEVVPVYFDDPNEWENAFASGAVEAQLTSSVKLREDEEILVSFQQEKYYFAVTRGKSDIMRELNLAMEQINNIRPQFETDLYKKYFSGNSRGALSFTERERQFISENPVLRVVAAPDWRPISFFDAETGRLGGISGDILTLLEDAIGFTFEYMPTITFKEALAMLESGEADMVAGIYDTPFVTNNLDVTLSMPYLPTQTVIMQKSGTELQKLERPVAAMPYGFDYIGALEVYEIQYYDTVAECIDAVKSGLVDCTVLSNLAAEQDIRVHGKGGLSLVPIPNSSTQLSIAFQNPTDPALISIIDKAIYSISEERKQDVLFQNIFEDNSKVTLTSFIYANPMQALGIIATAAIILLMLIYLIMSLRLKLSRISTKNAEAEASIDSLTGLYNKKHSEQLVQMHFEKDGELTPSAMLIIDLDHFKQTNDTLGHLGGDAVLAELANTLRSNFCNGEILSRWGGDEFFVFIEDASDRENIVQTVRQLCGDMDMEFSYMGISCGVSITVGISFERENDGFAEMFKAADEALYEKKRGTKNGYLVAHDAG